MFAAWDPHAEFYVIRFEDDFNFDGLKPLDAPRKFRFETYYGAGSQSEVYKRMQEVGFELKLNQIWVEDDKVWLY